LARGRGGGRGGGPLVGVVGADWQPVRGVTKPQGWQAPVLILARLKT
jgi:hypothetical protein